MGGDENPMGRELELVAAARAGSHSAFGELESRYSRRLYRRIQSITRNHEDAEDALQETFLRAYLALDCFEGRSQFATWITRIAINSALMILRRRRSRPEVSIDPPPESGQPVAMNEVRDTALNPEQLHDLRERSEYALRAIGQLDFSLRTPMTAWIEQECSMKEVARTLGLSVAAVKSRVHRARKKLTGSMVFKRPVRKAGSRSESRRRYRIPDFRNRELACPSFN
jgi:RNA polymerase sigma-70 factor (ECF subfamily)